MKSIIEDVFVNFPQDVKGKKVLIKPNMLGPFEVERGVTTNPVLIEALVDYLIDSVNLRTVSSAVNVQNPVQ